MLFRFVVQKWSLHVFFLFVFLFFLDGKFFLRAQLFWQQAAICSKVRAASKHFLSLVIKGGGGRVYLRSNIKFRFICLSFHPAAAQHLRMQNEQA